MGTSAARRSAATTAISEISNDIRVIHEVELTKFPVRLFAVAFAFSVLVTACGFGLSWRLDQILDGILQQDLQTQEYAGKVMLLDEALTMSARMAAATGDFSYKERYVRLDAELVELIERNREAFAAPEVLNSINQTKAANYELVKIEKRGMELAAQGRIAEATSMLADDQYGTWKQSYRDGVDRLLRVQREVIADDYRYVAELRFVLRVSRLLTILILLFLWMHAFRAGRRWNRERSASLAALRQSQDKLHCALDEQRRANQMQRDFVTMASHEFRTPLAIIDGGAQRILRRVGRLSDDEIIERTTKIRGAVSRMERLMESFLASARTETEAIELTLEDCDLRQVIESVCAETRIVSPSHRVDVDVAGLPELVRVDPNLFGHVVANMLSNAIKYSPNADRVEVHGRVEGARVLVAVHDFGRGIPADEIGQVFDRFFRAATASGIAGTGIGLSLARHIVEQHGGTIDVESTLGQGSTFTVHLPIGIAESRQDSAFSPLSAGQPAAATAG